MGPVPSSNWILPVSRFPLTAPPCKLPTALLITALFPVVATPYPMSLSTLPLSTSPLPEARMSVAKFKLNDEPRRVDAFLALLWLLTFDSQPMRAAQFEICSEEEFMSETGPRETQARPYCLRQLRTPPYCKGLTVRSHTITFGVT
jgi:hypothetical protein